MSDRILAIDWPKAGYRLIIDWSQSFQCSHRLITVFPK